jgi:hypothetical protein
VLQVNSKQRRKVRREIARALSHVECRIDIIGEILDGIERMKKYEGEWFDEVRIVPPTEQDKRERVLRCVVTLRSPLPQGFTVTSEL